MTTDNKEDNGFDLSKVTFVSGTELSNGELIMIAHPKGMDPGKNPKSIFLIRDTNGKWFNVGSVKWLPEWVSGNPKQDSIVMIHWGGSCLEFNEKKNSFSSVYQTEEDKDDPPSELRFSKVVNDQLYVGGTNRFLFQQVGTQWNEISIEAMKGEPMPSSFENITGFSADELYAFGWEGVIWTNKDKVWKQAKSPTESMLFDGAVLDDKVYIGGQLGIILEGRGEVFTEVTSDLSNSDLLSVCAFDGAVYFSNTQHILRLKDSKLEVFQKSTPEFKTYKLFTGPSGLWSVSSNHLALYNGIEWKIIVS